ncbi:MAG: TrkA C-terminal domain-containing protein, partial [Deinococcales bacterium]
AVLERMAELGIGRMPVVDRRDTRRPIGMVRQADLARAYYLALERERLHEETREALRLRDVTGQEIVEVRIPKGSSLEGRRLRDAGLPEASIVVAVRRRGRTLFPHGDTTLEAGDMVVASVAHGHVRGFREAFQKPPSPGREER